MRTNGKILLITITKLITILIIVIVMNIIMIIMIIIIIRILTNIIKNKKKKKKKNDKRGSPIRHSPGDRKGLGRPSLAGAEASNWKWSVQLCKTPGCAAARDRQRSLLLQNNQGKKGLTIYYSY